MPQYQKRPLIVEAEQFDEKTYRESKFLASVVRDKASGSELFFAATAETGRYHIENEQLFGGQLSNGDYVIKGVKGEIYICSKEVFEQSYDLVEVAGEA